MALSPTSPPILHPLTLGQLLDRALRLYRRNFWTFVGIAAAAQIPAVILQRVVAWGGGRSSLPGSGRANHFDHHRLCRAGRPGAQRRPDIPGAADWFFGRLRPYECAQVLVKVPPAQLQSLLTLTEWAYFVAITFAVFLIYLALVGVIVGVTMLFATRL